MVLRKNRISPQYISKNQITTTILDVINPAHYILKECPSCNSSSEAREFAEAEDSMQKYYDSIEPCFFQMPVKDSIVVVRFENKFYRASVISILALSAGHLFKVYLLDYGKECSVPRNCLFEIQKDFLAHPFQAVNFKLLGLEPVSLVLSSVDLSVSYGPVSEWDIAAVNHIRDLQKVMCNAYIEIKASDEKSVYGNLFLTFGDASVKCINEEFVQKKYARYNEDCWKSVQSIDLATGSPSSSSKKSPVSKSLSPLRPNHHSPHSSKIVPKFEDLNVKFIRPSDDKVVGETSFMSESKSSFETLENQQQMVSGEVGKQSIQTLPANTETSQKVQSESCKKLLMLQKLHRQKQLSNNQSSAQCDNLQKSLIAPTEISNTNAEDSLSKGPRKDLKNVNHGRPAVSKSKGINSGDNECDTINSSLSSEPKQSNVRVLEDSPKQGASSGAAEISPGNLKKLQMFQKLKEMKRSHLQQPSEKTEGLKEGEKSEIKSQSCAKSSPSNSNILSVSPREFSPCSDCPVSPKEDSNVTQKSPIESSPKCQVDFQKVKALYKKRQLFQSSSMSEKMSHALNIESEVQVDATPSEQSCDIDPTNVSTSDTSAVEKSETKPCLYGRSESEFHAGDFITCSSPKTSSEAVSTRSPDSKSESNITNNCILPGSNRSINTSHSNSSKDSIESMLDKLTMSPPIARLDSEILKTLSDMSDSDDILYQYTRKRSQSLSDKSDEEDFDVTLCTQLKHTELKQLMDFSQLSLWEKQRIPVLQIGENPHSPVLCVEEAPFSPKLHKVLKEIKFYGPSCIQSVVWPSLARTRSLIAIAPPHAGKTVAYVLPIVSYFMDQEGLLPEGNGPIYIILCSSWKKVQDVNDFLRFFLGNTKAKIVTLCADGGHYKSKVQTLINGCDILIATPFCLLNFFKTNSVSFYRCTGFILDDGTTLITQNKKQLKYLLLHFMNGVKRKVKAPQLIVCAERWNKAFQVMMDKIMSRPLLFFTSFLESAIFAQIPMFGHVCDPDEKMQAILGVLKDTGKVVICTTNAEDAKDIHHYLRCEDIKTYLATEQMEHFIADEVIKDWKSARCMTSSHCLVITDQALIRMCISSADCLIHYDVPHDSRLQFGNRFSCIAEHFQMEEDSQKCECHIFITKSDYSCASYLIDIIESAGGNAPVELKALTEIENKVENKSNMLCKYMKAFGFCKERHCEYRHYIDLVLDKPQVIPCEGDIQGLVTQVVDASHYYVRLQKYLDVETNKTVSFNAAYAEVGFRLKDFYSVATKDMEVESPVVGENYVLVEENVFYRIKVLEEVNPASYTEFPKWKVLFLDEGWIKCYEKLKLYKLTDKIQIPEFLAFEVYICNILTPDSCLDWNPQTTHLISSLIKGQEIYGKIVLCLGSTLWLDPVVLRTHLHGINDYINQTKIHKKLIDAGHAKENNNHLNVLQDACTGKVPLPRIIKRNAKEEEETQDESPVSYAFLNCGVNEDVYVSSVISPERLYIQRAKFVQCLDDLLDKINGLVERRMLRKCSTICKGMHCIAPFPEDGRYYRAVISDIPSNEDVQLFFVDFGDTGKISKKDIFYLPPEFLLLPFQAIECELAGISAAHGGWTNSAIDMLYDLTRDDAGDMKILQLKAYSKTRSYEGGNHYVIDLWYDEKCLSEQLLLAGFGIPAEIPTETTHVYASDKTEEQVDDESFDLDDECSTSDREMHPEDKDAAALFCGVLSNMVLQAYDGVHNNAATITEVTSDDENPINKPSNSSSSVSNTTNNLNLENNSVERSRVVGDTTLKSDSHKPLISWWDTPQQLSILINLKGIKVYHLDLTDEGFTFNTVVAGIQYFTEEKLYAKIKGSESTKYQSAQGINIVAKKQTPFKWPRLIQEKKRFLHIKYDLIHIDDSDSDETSKDANNNEDIPVEASSSTSDEDEYCPPWKEVGKYKDPYNLLE